MIMKKIIYALLLLLILIACTKTITSVTYYILDFPTEIRKEGESSLTNDVCEILPVQIAEVYAQQRIALRKRSHEIIYYHYHQWGESPEVNISRLIQKKLSSDGLFDHISDRVWSVSPRYELSVHVNNLEVVEGDDSLFAHVNIDMELFDRQKSKTAVMHSFDHSIGLEEFDLNDISMAMSTILRDELNTFSYKTRVYLISQIK
jgi:ABC-type uncharacterized transport system auxiliary subunit